LCKDSEGTLWFTGYKGLNAIAKGKNVYEDVSYPLKDSVEGVRIRPIIEDRKKRLWIGTYDGLYMRPEASGRSFKRIEFQDTLRREVYALAEDNRQQLWIGTAKGLYCMMPDSSLVPQLVDSTLVHIIDIFTDKEYRWISSEKGLFRMAGDKVEQWSDKEAHCVITDATGQTWVGTDNGLCRITGREILLFPSPADGHIVKDLLYWHDFLWCCYDQGICCINIYTGKSTMLHTLYNEYMEGAAFLDTKSGTLYFGGSQGIDCFVADSLEPQLRSGVGHIWLEEVREDLVLSGEEDETTVKWWLWFVMLVVICAVVIVGFAFAKSGKRSHKTVKAQEKTETITKDEMRKTLTETELAEDYEGQEPDAQELSPFVAKVTEFVNDHLADTELTAEMMAREMAMSRSKLFELMKQETGKPVMEFVRDLRLEYAARRLEAGDSVAEITYACGFSDPSSFRRAFANKYGVTPSQYRAGQKS
jgi:AraC-like DNA-binding protein